MITFDSQLKIALLSNTTIVIIIIIVVVVSNIIILRPKSKELIEQLQRALFNTITNSKKNPNPPFSQFMVAMLDPKELKLSFCSTEIHFKKCQLKAELVQNLLSLTHLAREQSCNQVYIKLLLHITYHLS